MHELVGLKPKLYSYSYENISSTEKKEKQAAKGIQKATITHCLRHEHYKQCLFIRKDTMHQMDTIRSFEHNLFMTRINKTSVSMFDDKRYYLDIAYYYVVLLLWGLTD